MDKTSFRVLTLTVSCMLFLSTTAERAVAWPCPPCSDCYTCFPTGCEYNCGTGETCCGGSCCNDKCWDTYTAILGSISVQNAELCQQVTHTSSISDTDHWIQGGGSEGWLFDTVTYSWSQTAGTNPQIGTFIGDTNDPSVVWKAPPCTGTVNIKLTANDKPDSMDNPCPSSTRDDDPKDFEDTSTVSLPTGCSDCLAGPPASPTPSITEDTSCGCCQSGVAGCAKPGSSHTYTLETPCYEDCKWYAGLDSVDTTFEICRSCPDNHPTVACLGDVAAMTQQKACDHLTNFPNNPVQYADIDVDNWCRDCVAVHEEEHMNKDWIEDSLQPEINSFATWYHGINIDCSVSASTDCATALTPTEKAAYDTEWGLRVQAAINTWNAETEADAEAAELACYQDIYNALDAKCNP